MRSVVLPFCKQDNLRSPKQLIIKDCARRFVLKLYRHEASRGLIATAELLVTIHGETTFADKRMNPVHFESITVNRHIRVVDSKYGTFNDIFLPPPAPWHELIRIRNPDPILVFSSVCGLCVF